MNAFSYSKRIGASRWICVHALHQKLTGIILKGHLDGALAFCYANHHF
jgi:hypothetical protein